MTAYIKRSLFATTMLMAVGGVGGHALWAISSGELWLRQVPDATKTEIAAMEDPKRLRELAIRLVDSTNQTTDVANQMLVLVEKALLGLIFASVLSILFVWGNVWDFVKERRRAEGKDEGWLKWF